MAGGMAKYEIGAGERSRIVRVFMRPKDEKTYRAMKSKPEMRFSANSSSPNTPARWETQSTHSRLPRRFSPGATDAPRWSRRITNGGRI